MSSLNCRNGEELRGCSLLRLHPWIVYTGKDPSVARVANQFAEDYELMFGRRMQVVQGRAAAGDFVFSLSSDSRLGEEGYTMKITDRVTVTAPKSKGLYWATRTLLQLTEQQGNQALPKGAAVIIPTMRSVVL